MNQSPIFGTNPNQPHSKKCPFFQSTCGFPLKSASFIFINSMALSFKTLHEMNDAKKRCLYHWEFYSANPGLIPRAIIDDIPKPNTLHLVWHFFESIPPML
jgi:hypothetical protein